MAKTSVDIDIRKARSPGGRRYPHTGEQGPAHPARMRGRPAPAPRAPQASQFPGPPAQTSVHPPSRPPSSPEKITRAGRTHTGMHARLGGTRQARTRSGLDTRTPQAATHTAAWPLSPSAICPWMPQHSGLRRYEMTHSGTKQNGTHSRESAASGPLSQVVAGGGFEPPKAKPTVLQTAPFGRSGNLPGRRRMPGGTEKNSGRWARREPRPRCHGRPPGVSA